MAPVRKTPEKIRDRDNEINAARIWPARGKRRFNKYRSYRGIDTSYANQTIVLQLGGNRKSRSSSNDNWIATKFTKRSLAQEIARVKNGSRTAKISMDRKC